MVALIVIIAAVGVVVGFIIWKKKKVTPAPSTSVTKTEKKPTSPIMLQEPDGRETITPSQMSAHLQSRNNSHGKLKQVLGRECTMTDEAKFKSEQDADTNEGGLNMTDVEASDAEASPRKLPPITDSYVPPKSPAADTHLQDPLPPILNQ